MSPVADALRLALAAAIRANEAARDASARLAGKTMLLETAGQRLRLRFEDGEVAVDGDASGEDEADVTVRGSLPALLRAFASDKAAERVAVIGDTELFEDFRTAFRPHLQLPDSVSHLAEDAGDAVRVGVQAARSAAEGVGRAVRDKAQDYFAGSDEHAAQLAALAERVDALEARVRELESGSGDSPGRPGPKGDKGDPGRDVVLSNTPFTITP